MNKNSKGHKGVGEGEGVHPPPIEKETINDNHDMPQIILEISKMDIEHYSWLL